MIKVITAKETNIDSSDFNKRVVSHGVDTETGRNVIMECITLEDADYIIFNRKHGWIVSDALLNIEDTNYER